jgi:uroporphyrinogen decarboxylase
MNKRERVLNAMDKKEVDHVPVGFWYHYQGEFAKGEACVQAHLAYYNEIDADIMKIMCDGYFPYPITIDIQKASDWYNLKPLGKDHPYLAEQVWRVKRIKEETGNERAVFYNVNAPFSSLRNGAGNDLIMRHLKEDKGAVMHALDVVAQDNALVCELCVTEGKADGIYYPVQGGELGRFNYDEYVEMISPSDLFVLKHMNNYSDYNILHACGWAGHKNRLELWKDYPAKAVNWAVYVEEVSLEQGREYFGGRCCLGGYQNVRPGILFYGTEEEIKASAKEIIRSFGKTGLILGGDCTIPWEVEHKRMKWVVEASREI